MNIDDLKQSKPVTTMARCSLAQLSIGSTAVETRHNQSTESNIVSRSDVDYGNSLKYYSKKMVIGSNRVSNRSAQRDFEDYGPLNKKTSIDL